MLANVPNTQAHSHSCTFFSHVPCYVREHTVEEHHRTHSLTYVPAHVPAHEKKKKKKKKKKLTHACIVGDKIAHLYIQMSFPHVFHMFSTFPHFIHIFWRVFHIFLEFPTFYQHSHICIYS